MKGEVTALNLRTRPLSIPQAYNLLFLLNYTGKKQFITDYQQEQNQYTSALDNHRLLHREIT